jgi:hypothetical protein
MLRLANEGWVQIKTTLDQWMAFHSIPTYFVTQKLWFYVPENIKALYYAKTEGEHPVFIDSQGKESKPSVINSLSTFRLQVKNSGWWQIQNSGYKFLQFYSTPGLFFLHPNYAVSSK